VVTENVAVDAATGEPLVMSRSSAFIRGEGGFGGERGTDAPWERPDRTPDYQVVQPTRPEQALIYRVVVEYSAAGLDLGLRRRHDRHPCLSRWLTGCW
jgi:hypothetical protein